MKTSSSLIISASLTLFISLFFAGCVESPPAETTNAADIPPTEVITPEDGGEPVLAEEGP